ncbi:MAG TPA: YcxB family protein [Myxococcales bacterium]|nr:YcxB family protein [Myxococcales bacterium]
MRIAYTLGEPDLQAMLLQHSLWRRDRIRAWFERVRTGPFLRHLLVNIPLGALVGLLLYPLWTSLLRCLRLWRFSPGLYAAAVALAVVLATVLQRWISPPRLRLLPVYRWSVRRRMNAVRKKSVLGRIELTIEEDGLVRVNAAGELKIPWSEVVVLLDSPALFTAVLSRRRVVVAPLRAFADDAAARAFRAEVERRSGKQAVFVPDAP